MHICSWYQTMSDGLVEEASYTFLSLFFVGFHMSWAAKWEICCFYVWDSLLSIFTWHLIDVYCPSFPFIFPFYVPISFFSSHFCSLCFFLYTALYLLIRCFLFVLFSRILCHASWEFKYLSAFCTELSSWV
ncbi:hypothetical protein BJ508DRAFT_83801 [Ascobolus immersus RN42]|uniref:Uncharacterized protein n=1 Tax=Ascobolus immersus RN42 TaxID=1160509 RepID=A0A3N4IBA1_ASCIM|nr:hypothetical protein BJ508DRAFT_83801 [Ascobolus immersus RN42]